MNIVVVTIILVSIFILLCLYTKLFGACQVWSQLCLELSRSERSCPLHPALQQASLTAFKDRAGRWLLHPEPTVDVDVDLPERSYWLLAPLEVPQEAVRVGQ